MSVCKEFPGAVMARMTVKLPAVLGILGAEQPPRYVPVSRIRAAMKTTQFEEQAARLPAASRRCRPPAVSARRPGATPRCSPARKTRWPPGSPRFSPRKDC